MRDKQHLMLGEHKTRQVILARAIEQGDAQGKLLGETERDRIDQESRRTASPDSKALMGEFIHERAVRVISTVEPRDPWLAGLQNARPWQLWLAAGIPVLAFTLGVVSNIIGNPHRVDLVSLPLLGIVVWNVIMYIVLIAGWAMAGRGRKSWVGALGRWSDGNRALSKRPGNARAQAAAHFWREWFKATQGLYTSRIKRVLHLSAAAWAVGVIASLLVRGLVVEYRVGWESTFLDASQVNTLLNVLRVPAQLLFPLAPFTTEQVGKLQFSVGGGTAEGASTWVFMYVALLLVVVVIPRLVLAAIAWVRERFQAGTMSIDASDPYYERIASLLDVARVELCLITHSTQDREQLMRVLVQEADIAHTLVSSDQGDVLRITDLSGKQPPALRVAQPVSQDGPSAFRSWLGTVNKVFKPSVSAIPLADPTLQQAWDHGDLVLHMAHSADDIDAARPLVEWLGKPVLVIGTADLARGAIAFDSFARNWSREQRLFDTIAALLPKPSAAACTRLAKAWDQRNRARFGRSMDILAEHLLLAAKQSEDVPESGFPALRAADRHAREDARAQAMKGIVARLDESARSMLTRLRQVHGIKEESEAALQHRLEREQLVQRRMGQGNNMPVAETAGGAAVGAGVGFALDLLAGGLMLGAATAAGAAIGGWVGAAWTKRGTSIALSNEMLQAMVEAALLRYLAVIHHGRLPAGEEPVTAWTSEVVAQVAADNELYTPFWTVARSSGSPAEVQAALGRQLESTALKVLSRI
ncbi:MAG: DUF2868 domain-containing protein [Pseudomonadota bacterium]